MKSRTQYLVPIVITGLMLTAAVSAAQRGGSTDRAPGRHWGTVRTSAVAALNPVGAVDGWGRVMVMDLATEDELDRMATVHLYGLEPYTEYSVLVNELPLATLVTDSQGDGCVRLDSRNSTSDQVPDHIPLAAGLETAEVFDPSLALTLEGDFQVFTNGGFNFGGLEYMERIELESVAPAVIRGVARVARSLDDVQFFESRACGLDAGRSYTVTVDGFPAGVVTADMVGHGSIFLATGGNGDPLPNDLQPIEGLREVAWKIADDAPVTDATVILWGTFTWVNMVRGSTGAGGDDGGHGDDNGGGHGEDNGGGHGGDNGGGHGGDDDGHGGDHGGDNGDGTGGGGGGGRP